MSNLPYFSLGPNINYLGKVKRYLEYKLKSYIGIRNIWEGGAEYILFSRNGLSIRIQIEYGDFFKTPTINIEATIDNYEIVNEFLRKFPNMKVFETENGYIIRHQLAIYSAIYADKESYKKDKETINKILDIISKI